MAPSSCMQCRGASSLDQATGGVHSALYRPGGSHHPGACDRSLHTDGCAREARCALMAGGSGHGAPTLTRMKLCVRGWQTSLGNRVTGSVLPGRVQGVCHPSFLGPPWAPCLPAPFPCASTHMRVRACVRVRVSVHVCVCVCVRERECVFVGWLLHSLDTCIGGVGCVCVRACALACSHGPDSASTQRSPMHPKRAYGCVAWSRHPASGALFARPLLPMLHACSCVARRLSWL